MVLAAGDFPPEATLRALTCPQTSAGAYRELADRASAELRGLDMLAWILRAALYTHEEYARRGMAEGVYLDTMKCFSRFVREHKASYGIYGFDRGFWTYRQLSLSLFRLGELEYEWRQDVPSVGLHVPSDADIALPLCRLSLVKCDRFAAEFCPGRDRRPIEIESWLLSCLLYTSRCV